MSSVLQYILLYYEYYYYFRADIIPATIYVWQFNILPPPFQSCMVGRIFFIILYIIVVSILRPCRVVFCDIGVFMCLMVCLFLWCGAWHIFAINDVWFCFWWFVCFEKVLTVPIVLLHFRIGVWPAKPCQYGLPWPTVTFTRLHDFQPFPTFREVLQVSNCSICACYYPRSHWTITGITLCAIW